MHVHVNYEKEQNVILYSADNYQEFTTHFVLIFFQI